MTQSYKELCLESDKQKAVLEKSYQLEKQIAEQTAELVMSSKRLQEEIIEKEKTQKHLKESESRLFLAMSAANMGICDWDLTTDQGVWMNVTKLYGLPDDTQCPNFSDFLNLIYIEDRSSAMQAIDMAVQKGVEVNIEYQVIWPDGSLHWLCSIGKVYHNDNYQPVRLILSTKDITERKLVEETLRENEMRLNLALETLKMGIWERNLITDKCIWSDSIGPLYGLPQGSLCPLSHEEFFNLIYPEDRDLVIQFINNSAETENELTVEYRAIWPDGNLHWLRSTGKLYYNPQGQPARIIGITRDISDPKQKEQTLYEQAALLDIVTDAIFVRDFQTEILFWNQGAERMYGWQKHEVLGKHLKDIFHSKTTSQQEAVALKAVLKSGIWQGELHKETKLGKQIIVESRWTLMFDGDGQPKSILTVDTDITERKQLQEQFFRSQRIESIGTLAGGIAHDINNILTPILGSAQLLKSLLSPDQENEKQMLTTIEVNAKRGANLIKKLLSFARGVSNKCSIVNVKDLIKEIMQVAMQTFPKDIEFSQEISEKLSFISGDITQLHQVLVNLLVNARDAMPQGGKIHISAENLCIDETYQKMNCDAKVGNYVVITVRDTGEGISRDTLERIFEPFFSTKDTGKGTGLGLSTALGIIKEHNGFIKVFSEVNKGSQFQVFLPAITTGKPLEENEDVERYQGNGELILVVDDEEKIREITRRILECYNYRVITACSGMDAIALYVQHQSEVNVILMDIMMPEMDGITAIRTLKKINPHIQVIACTGMSTTDILESINNTQIQSTLLKPYTNKELLRKINNLILGKRIKN